jgi:hypothetical protein
MSDITNEQLSAYLDDALSPKERASVERSLAESPNLQKELADLKKVKDLLQSAPLPEPPEQFYTNVLAKTKVRPRAWGTWTFPLIGAAAAAMLMVYVVHDSKPTPLPVAHRAIDNASMGMDPDESFAFQETLPRENLSLKGESPRMDPGFAKPPIPRKGMTEPVQDAAGMAMKTPRSEIEVSAGKPMPAMKKSLVPPQVASASDTTVQEWKGDSSGITIQREVVIKDPESWAQLWAEHQSPRGTPSAPPAIDFENQMIVGIFLGDRGSSGYAVEILSILVQDNESIITYKETKPDMSGGMGFLAVMTQPYHLKAIPPTNTPVRFMKR